MKNQTLIVILAIIISAFFLCRLSIGAVNWSGNIEPGDPRVWDSGTNAYIGNYYDGSMTVDYGSDVWAYKYIIGNEPDCNGVVSICGEESYLDYVLYIVIGDSGNGRLDITDGGVVNSRAVNRTDYIGRNFGSVGVVNVSGPNTTWYSNNNTLLVGDSGRGELVICNGAKVKNLASQIGITFNSSGLVTVDGNDSLWEVANMLRVGGIGKGTLNIFSSGEVRDNDGVIGYSAGSVGEVTLCGSKAFWKNSNRLSIGGHTNTYGNVGKGTLKILEGAGVVNGGTGYIAYKSGSEGCVIVSGADSRWSNLGDLIIGRSGVGELTIAEGATVSVGGQLTGASYYGTGYINIASSGKLALWGEYSSLSLFLDSISGKDAIRYWDDCVMDWVDIGGIDEGSYTLEYVNDSCDDLNGYTVLTVFMPGAPEDYDVDQDRDVDFHDFSRVAYYWGESGCAEPEWCGRADIDRDGEVGILDLKVLAEAWLFPLGCIDAD